MIRVICDYLHYTTTQRPTTNSSHVVHIHLCKYTTHKANQVASSKAMAIYNNQDLGIVTCSVLFAVGCQLLLYCKSSWMIILAFVVIYFILIITVIGFNFSEFINQHWPSLTTVNIQIIEIKAVSHCFDS